MLQIDHLAQFVKSDSITATTNANGYITSTLLASVGIVVSAIKDDRAVIPFVSNTGYWCFRVTWVDDMTPVKNTSVTVNYYYIEL